MFQHTHIQTVQTPSGQLNPGNLTVEGAAHVEIEESCENAATTAITVALDVSAVKSFIAVSTKNVILETNSPSSPADTINLVANVPYIWHTSSYDAFALGTDVTSIHITNASGAAATVKIRALSDPTP